MITKFPLYLRTICAASAIGPIGHITGLTGQITGLKSFICSFKNQKLLHIN
jgi:hypothetical protein